MPVRVSTLSPDLGVLVELSPELLDDRKGLLLCFPLAPTPLKLLSGLPVEEKDRSRSKLGESSSSSKEFIELTDPTEDDLPLPTPKAGGLTSSVSISLAENEALVLSLEGSTAMYVLVILHGAAV